MNTQFLSIFMDSAGAKAVLCLLLLSCLGVASSPAQEKTGEWSNDGPRPGYTTQDFRKAKQKDESAGHLPQSTPSSAAAPQNDNFAAASQLGTSYIGSVTNVDATAETGEPTHGAGRGGTTVSKNSIWYKFVPASNGVAHFKTSQAGANPIEDTVISAYTGSAVNALTPVAECDDYLNNLYGRITFGVTAGTTYYVAVDGFQTRTGTFQVQYQFSASPPNDFSYSPESLGALAESPFIGVTGSNVGATEDVGETVHFSNGVLPLNSVWYEWSPPVSGTYTFTTEGSNFDTVIAVYFTLFGTILGPRGSNDDFGPHPTRTSRVTFFASSGETFRIAIDGYGTDKGNIVLNWYRDQEEGGKKFDLDGDERSDLSIFRPSNGQWWVKRSSGGTYAATFGTQTDKQAPADYTGDGKVDIAFWRPSDGQWYVLRSEDFSYYAFPYGTSGDIPVPAKFDNDQKADHAIYRPSTNTWFIRNSRTGIYTQQNFGIAGDIPVVADYDADGEADIAIFRPSNGQWWINRSGDGVIALTFGASGDVPVPGAYTGLGFANVAVWRPSTGEWFVLRYLNSASYYSFPFGLSTDIPAPGDFDGDGTFDATVFRPSTGTWYSQRASGAVAIEQFGLSGDRPLQSSFIP